MYELNETLLLRKFETEDINSLYLVKNNIEAKSLLGGFSNGYSKEDIKKWIDYHNNKNDEVIFAIYNNNIHDIIGHVGLYNIDFRIRKAEYAILIADHANRGKGYGALCTQFMLSYGFEQLNLKRIELSVLEDNVKAISLYYKNGFEKEGVLRNAQFKNGKYHNVLLMAKLR
jgi:RimJ/RimL family protein N-acetyltransferase